MLEKTEFLNLFLLFKNGVKGIFSRLNHDCNKKLHFRRTPFPIVLWVRYEHMILNPVLTFSLMQG